MNGKKRDVTVASVVLGLGIGGFFDGIVLHQILQWHHLLTDAGYPPTTVENLQVNTLADGLFHASTWILSLIGLFLLWRALRGSEMRWPTRLLVGGMLMGWGIFNLVEGLINHQILGIHHVRTGPDQLAWDLGFLVWGAVMLLAGWWLTRSAPREERRFA